MAGSVFAPKYAYAFAQVVEWHHLDAARALAQMNDFRDLLTESPQLHEVLTDPSIPGDQKLSVLDALAERLGTMREVRNFLAILIDNQRLPDLNEILAEVALVADESGGIADATVTTARALDPDSRQQLEVEVGKLANSRVRVTWTEDPALLGGAIIRIGSTVYDGSVRAQLEQLKQTLVTA